MKDSIHVLPVEDRYDHCDSVRCPCRPKVELGENGGLVIIHRSFDRRELFEKDRRLTIEERVEKLTLLPGVYLHRARDAYLRWRLNQIYKKPGVKL